MKPRRPALRYHGGKWRLAPWVLGFFPPHDHRTLAGVLHACRGMVVLSGYPSPLYDELYGAWERHERAHLADGARRRTEVLWLNPACARALKERLPLEAPAVTLPSTEPGTGPQEENDQA